MDEAAMDSWTRWVEHSLRREGISLVPDEQSNVVRSLMRLERQVAQAQMDQGVFAEDFMPSSGASMGVPHVG